MKLFIHSKLQRCNRWSLEWISDVNPHFINHCLSVFVHYPSCACYFFAYIFSVWNNFFYLKYFALPCPIDIVATLSYYCNYLSMLGLELAHVIKIGPSTLFSEPRRSDIYHRNYINRQDHVIHKARIIGPHLFQNEVMLDTAYSLEWLSFWPTYYSAKGDAYPNECWFFFSFWWDKTFATRSWYLKVVW